MSAREDLAAAASSVDGITVTPYLQQYSKPGRGYVRTAQLAPDTRFAPLYVATWEVVIPLGQDHVQAEKLLDRWAVPLLVALAPHLRAVTLTPVSITYDEAQVDGLVINGTREA
jgi:hypothetical protein